MRSSACRCAGSTTWSARPSRCWSGPRLDEARLSKLPGIRENEPLSRHSWYGIGGPARFFPAVTDDGGLDELVPYPEETRRRFAVVGGGSNTLVAGSGSEGP